MPLFKWAYDALTQRVEVWEVSSVGDGLPTHVQHLYEAWGRAASGEAGDVVGSALIERRKGDLTEVIVIEVFFGRELPSAVIDWFRSGFPSARISSRSSKTGATT